MPLSQQGIFWPELISAKDLLDMPEDPTRWIWDSCLPAGSSSILVARPKIGKSHLATCLSVAIARGYPFLGRAIQQGTVAYISLDANLSEVKEVFQKFELRSSDPIFIHAGGTPSKAVKWLMDQIAKHSVKLVVVDTIQRLFQFKNINDYSEVSNKMEPVMEATRERNCHIMFLHHAGKNTADDLDSAVGSVVLRGMCYTFLHIKRLYGSGQQRILLSDQRGGRNFDEIAISDGSNGLIEKMGTRADAEIETTKPLILAFLKDTEEPTPEKTIKENVPRKGIIVSKALRILLKKNDIERTGTGRRGMAFRYTIAGHIFESHPEELEDKELFDK